MSNVFPSWFRTKGGLVPHQVGVMIANLIGGALFVAIMAGVYTVVMWVAVGYHTADGSAVDWAESWLITIRTLWGCL